MRRKVYICAPLEEDILYCLNQFRRYVRFAHAEEVSPVGVHFYLLCYANQNVEDFQATIEERMSLLWYCDELWVFGEKYSEMMKQEISFCENINLPIRYVTEKEVKKKVGE